MAATEVASALARGALAPALGQSGPDGVGAVRAGGGAKEAGGESFGDVIARALDGVNQDLRAADAGVTKVVRAEPVELHEVMMNLEKADVSVRLMTQVGRRVVSAYREIMRMNV